MSWMQRKMRSSNNKNNSEKLLHRKKLKMVEDCNDPMNLHRKKQKKREVHDYCSMDALERAEEIHSSLCLAFPSLVKPMLHSHVSSGFWLGLPAKFCSSHLPKEDATITLEDENGENYEAKYLAHKLGLSGGWRGFAIAHNLVEGDVVVFQLVKPTKFKVYIVRSNQPDQVGGPTGVLEHDHFSNKSASDAESNSKTDSDVMLVVKDKDKKDVVVSNNVIDIKHPTRSDDSKLVVDGNIIDSEIPNDVKVKYYELCSSQGQSLHKNLVKGLNFKLAAGIISETVNIAEAIRTSKITSYGENIPKWEKTLSSFKDLGMEVGFLVARVKKLKKLGIESQRLNDARLERGRVEQEKIKFDGKLKKLDFEIKKLEKRHESIFHQTGNAPW